MRVSSHFIEETAFDGLQKEIYDVDEFFNRLNQSTNGELLKRILRQNNADNTAAMAELQAKYDALAKQQAEFKATLAKQQAELKAEVKAALTAKEKAEIKAAVAQQRAKSESARAKADVKAEAEAKAKLEAEAKLEAAQREIALLKSGKGPAGGPSDG